MRKILVFILTLVLCIIPFCSASSVFIEPVVGGMMWAAGASAGLGITSTGISMEQFDDFTNEYGIAIGGDSGCVYNPTDGSITVSSSFYNRSINKITENFGGSNTWRPSSMNPVSAILRDFVYTNLNDGTGTFSVNEIGGYPANVVSTSTNNGTFTINWSASLGKSQANSRLAISNQSRVYTNPRAWVRFTRLTLDGSNLTTFNSSYDHTFTAAQDDKVLMLYGVLELSYTGTGSTGGFKSVSPIPVINFDIWSDNIHYDAFVPSTGDYSLEMTIPADFDDSLVDEEVYPTVTLTPLNQFGGALLMGMANLQEAMEAYTDALLKNEVSSVSSTAGSETLPEVEDSVNDLIYGEVSWIRRLLQQLRDRFGSFADTITESVVAIKEHITAPFTMPELPPFLVGDGGGGLDFGFAGIWHYVKEWLGSMSAGLGAIFGVWAGIPYGLVVPIYASAVIVIVVGLFKRYIH